MNLNALKYINALLVTNPTNIRYLTGFVGVEKRDAYLLLVGDKKYLFVSPLYLEVAKKLSNIQIIQLSNNPIEKEIAKLTNTVGFEENDLTVAEYKKFKKVIRTLLPTKGKIEKLRMIKREDEIENIRKAAKITDQCFDYIVGKLKPGVSEKEIAWEIQRFLGDIAFSPIVAFGKNSSQPHYRSGSDLLKPQGLTLLDFGARVNGYCADMTRVVFMGKPKDEWAKAYNTVFEAQKAALAALSNMKSGAKLDRLAKSIIKKAGFPPYTHSLGHNVGLDIHEGPRLSVKKNATLKPGMVFTIEPGIYIEGQYGIRIEDLVLLRNDRIEVLSKSPKEMIVL